MEPLAPARPSTSLQLARMYMHTTGENSCRSASWLGCALSLTVALILEAFCWGFTVDDAWIVSRVAHHGLSTGVHSFNPGGPVTDAVTPLGFAHLISFIGGLSGLSSPLELWTVARWLGVGAFFISMGIAGHRLGSQGRRVALLSGVLSVLAVPSAAWAGAGLATSLVGLFIIVGAVAFRQRRVVLSAGFFGWASAWRPELTPFVVTWVLCRVLSGELAVTRSRAWKSLGLFLVVLALPVLTRSVAFGSLLPLSAVAKAPEVKTAVFYAGVTMIWSGVGWLIIARDRAFRRPGLWAVPWCAHLLAVFFAGGDWMPALRLTAPLFPLLMWDVGRDLRPGRLFWAAMLPGLGFPTWILLAQGEDFRAVEMRRRALVEDGTRALAGAEVIASTDIGWVGIASPAKIVDLGGVTDPRIARLPGGHTSKLVSPGLFSDRDVDTWVIRDLDRSYVPGAPLELIVPAYWVDARLLSRSSDLGFAGVFTVALPGTSGQYVIARRGGETERLALR